MLEECKTMLELLFPTIYTPNNLFSDPYPLIYHENYFFQSHQMRFLRLTGYIRVVGVDQKVNRCWLKYQILKSIVSALSGYFYGSQNPSGRSEILYIPKNVQKRCKLMNTPPLVRFLRDISRKILTRGGGLHGFTGFSTFFRI